MWSDLTAIGVAPGGDGHQWLPCRTMPDQTQPDSRWGRFARWLTTPRAIAITIPLMVLGTGLSVVLAGRNALETTIDIFAQARLDDQASALVAYLDQSLNDIDPVLAGLEEALRAGLEDVESDLRTRLVDRPWLRWLELRYDDGHGMGVVNLPAGGYDFVTWDVTGTVAHRRTGGSALAGAEGAALPIGGEPVDWDEPASRDGWRWSEITAAEGSNSLLIGRSHRAELDGTPVWLGAGVDLRQVRGLQRSDLLAEGMVAVALLDEHGRVLLERDRVPDPMQADRGLADPTLRAAAALLDHESTAGDSSLLEVDGVAMRALTRRLPSLTGNQFSVIAVADEDALRRPAMDYLVQSVLIKVLATVIALGLAVLYSARLLKTRRLLDAERLRADQAERLAHELGAYRLTGVIGRGGMGEVWAAEHRLLARPAAIKLVRWDEGEDADEAHRLFAREAQLTAALRCPHTVQLYDYGTTVDGRAYYAMELLDGIDLETLVMRYGPLAPPRVVSILIQICESLAEAHDLGLVHRDIKPGNILLCRMADRCDYVKVLDFGIAAVHTAAGALDGAGGGSFTAGTPGYMAPEQARGQPLDGRADLYSLGCVAWWLLTGRPVFLTTGSASDVVERHISMPLPNLRSPYGVPFVLDDLVRRCLAKEPAQRPTDARSLARALRASLHLMDGWSDEAAHEWWTQHRPTGPETGPPTSASGEEDEWSSGSLPRPRRMHTVMIEGGPSDTAGGTTVTSTDTTR